MRLALATQNAQLFAVTSRDGQYICLTVRLADAGTTASTCRLSSGLHPDDVIWIGRSDQGDESDVFGLAPDGIASVRAGNVASSVKSNAFVLENVPSSIESFSIEGPNLRADIRIRPRATTTTVITDG